MRTWIVVVALLALVVPARAVTTTNCNHSLSAATSSRLGVLIPEPDQCDWETPLNATLRAYDTRLCALDTTGTVTAPWTFATAPEAATGIGYAVRSANGIEGRFRAYSTGAFLESPDTSLPDFASASHFVGLYDPGVKNGLCSNLAASSKGATCGADSDCGGTVGACVHGSRCDTSSAGSAGNACQIDSQCAPGSCAVGTSPTNFPLKGRPVLETGGSRTFVGERRDFLVDGRPNISPGASGVCVKQGTACLTDASCAASLYCNGGVNKDTVCTVDANCPSAKCEPEYCVNLQCTKVFPFAGTCLKDADCSSPSGQTCWRGNRSFDLIVRGYDCAVDTGSVAVPGGDGRIDVAASNGEGTCVQSQTSGAGTASSSEHNWRWRVEIDSPGIPTKAAGLAKCRNTGASCAVQADCPGSFCQASDPYETNHLELNNEAGSTVTRWNRDGQMTQLGPTVFGDGIKRCTNNPIIQCTVDADCPPWQGGTLDVCRGDDIAFDASSYVNTAIQFSSNGFIKTLPGAIFRLSDTIGDFYSFTDGTAFADHKRDFRLQCNDGSCALANADSRHLKWRSRVAGTTNEWDMYATVGSSGAPELWTLRPGGSSPAFRLNFGATFTSLDGSIGDATGGGATYDTANGYFRATRKSSTSLPLCSVSSEGLIASATAANGSRPCVCEKVDSTPTYAWRVMGGTRLGCEPAVWQYQATSGTTISVLGRDVIELNYGSPANVTGFTGGVRGQRVTVSCLTANVTFIDSATLMLAGSANHVCALDEVMNFVVSCTQSDCAAGTTVWREAGRSVN